MPANGLLTLLTALQLTVPAPLAGQPPLRFDWRLASVRGTETRYWQALGPDSAFRIAEPERRAREIRDRIAALDQHEGDTRGCPAGMVRVTGKMKDPDVTLARQNAACEDGASWNPVYLCQNFDPAKLQYETATLLAMDYCIDRFEYPNVPGEFPATMLSWNDGQALCKLQGKRLCSEDEWSFACEGPEAWPYPYGYDRYLEPGAHFPDHIPAGDGCNIDVIRHVHADIPRMMRYRFAPEGLAEIDRLWSAVPAGSRAACTSPFGVRDLTGNIEEWTVQVPGRPPNLHGADSVLKGGYWSPVRSRCETAELAHGPGHQYYQTGFRCCSGP
jgi:formylglycine-generating enzyme required for sulfatase activity